jgi:hypothetical protein
LRELNEWNLLHEIRLDGTNILLNIEHRWKISIENSTCSYNDLKWYLEHKQKIWPSSLIWKVILNILYLTIILELIFHNFKKNYF